MDISNIKEKTIPILKEAGVIRSDLFGSYARGEQNDNSDIDILVELPKGNSLLDLVRLERKLTQTLGKTVELVTYKSISPLLEKYIKKDQLQLL